MKFLAHFLNVVSVLIPDFLLLPVIAAECFGLYRIARVCGLIPGTDVKLGLEVALEVAYVMAIVVNAINRCLSTARTRPGLPTRVVSRPAHHAGEVSSNKSQAQSAERRVLVTRP